MAEGDIQVEEISSTTVEPEDRPEVAPELLPHDANDQAPRYITVPRRLDLTDCVSFMEQTDYFRFLAKYICETAELSTIGYDMRLETNRAVVCVHKVTVHFSFDSNTGTTIMKCNILKNTIGLRNLQYTFAASMLLDYILKEYDFNIMLFCPRTDFIAQGFPTRQIKTEVYRFDSQITRIEQVVDRWMPFIERVKIMHIGNVHNIDQHLRCMRIFKAHFEGRVDGWQCDDVGMPIMNVLRRVLPKTYLQRSTLPIGMIFRWLRGWVIGVSGYTHLKEVYYSHPRLRLNRNVIHLLLNTENPPRPLGKRRLVLKSTCGKRASMEITRHGAFHFKLLKERDAPQKWRMPLRLPFSTNDLADINDNYPAYLEMDKAAFRNYENFATLVPEGER